MPRYFFDVTDSDGFHRDDVGDHFADLVEARDQAQALLSDIARDELPGAERHLIVCDVRAAGGDVLYRGELSFRGTTYEPAPGV